MDIVNFAHAAILLFALGALLYRLVIRRITTAPMLSQIFTTFGLMILLRGIAQYLWKPDFRSIDSTVVAGKVAVGGLQFGLPQIVAAAGAVLTTALVWWFLRSTRVGAALEATAADKEAAALMGIDAQRMFALAWGIGAACAGVAGALLSTYFPIFPEVGANFILIAFVLVALGGFGSVAGAFWGGILVGVVEVLGGLLVGPAYKMVLVLSLATKQQTTQNTAIVMLMTAQLGVAWNILGGYAGQVSLGHAAFFGCGAYVSSFLLLRFGISPWIGMVA